MIIFVFFMIALCRATSEIHIFIDQISDYTLLSGCAEHEVSTIVRNMENGCGDSQKTTSYNCFCNQSSSYYHNLIMSKVRAACTEYGAESVLHATAAAHVFGEYCVIGRVQAEIDAADTARENATASTAQASKTRLSNVSTLPAVPGSGAQPSSLTRTDTSQDSSATSSVSNFASASSTHNSDAKPAFVIAIIASVLVGCIAFAFGVGIACRRKRKRRAHLQQVSDGGTANNIETIEQLGDPEVVPKEMEVLPHEMPFGQEAIELNAEERRIVAGLQPRRN